MCMKKQEKKEHEFAHGAMEERSACSPRKTFHVKKKRKASDRYEDVVIGEMDKQDDEEEEKQLPRSNVSGSLIECA